MRLLPLILGLFVIVALTIDSVYDFFVTNEGVRYFSGGPRRLLYVLVSGLAGGLAAFSISRSSPGSQRRLKLTAIGVGGVLVGSGLLFFGYLLSIDEPSLTAPGVRGCIAAGFLSMLAVAFVVWWEFRRVRRQP